MTDLTRAARIICFRNFPAPGQRKCSDCDLAHQPAPPKQRAAPKPLKDVPEDLSGYSVEDFLP